MCVHAHTCTVFAMDSEKRARAPRGRASSGAQPRGETYTSRSKVVRCTTNGSTRSALHFTILYVAYITI